MKKLLSVFAAVLMTVSVAVGSISCKKDFEINIDFEDYEAGEKAFQTGHGGFEDIVVVGGVQVTAQNKDDILGDGGSVKYDEITETLTLTDAEIVNTEGHGIYAYGINLTVVGIDTGADTSNTVSGCCVAEGGIDEDGYEYTVTEPGYGIFVEGDGFPGNGGLTLAGTLGDISATGSSAISAYRDIVISGAVGDIVCTGGIESGIYSSFGSVVVEKDGVCGKIVSEEYNGISASDKVIISGRVESVEGKGASGIHVSAGDVIIDGSTDGIYGSVGGIEAYCLVDWDDNGNEIYSGGNVTLLASVGKILGASVGIYSENDLNIAGSTVVEAAEGEALAIGGIICEIMALCLTKEKNIKIIEFWRK